ncbi:MAG TPA: sigma-54 dependent transcriptional regulator [Gemmatimonadales bacterium]|jgi:DNA-binding NtrC family response regulator|nr:sigma-54 dependent transcriptional regulator [Gemmatimonadales bacterium]
MADSVLLIDDDVDILRSIGNYFEHLGYEVARELSGEAGLATFERLRSEVVILDLHLPGMDGLEVLERLRERGAVVILLTGESDIATAVRAMQLGAENFLTKPVDMAHLAAAVARASDKVRLRRVNEMLQSHLAPEQGLDSLGRSPAMQEFARQVGLLAQSERTTVLLIGESGTGKGWVARMIHNLSIRAKAPFVEVNAGGLSATFLDSELFGHEKGAFTDAKDRKQGLFEIADHGTIFLDEIGDLALELQPKLLKVLETKTFRRLGGTRELTVDVRLIAATNKDVSTEVETGRFREDLYYRLSVMPLQLPPVRDRSREDRLNLISRLMNDLRTQVPGGPTAISPDGLERMLGYSWPGNVREMRNVLERALILAQGKQEIGVEHLPGEFRARAGPGDRRHNPLSLDDLERQHIERTLRHHAGNRTRAAVELGISRATLINKIKRYSIPA